MANSMTVQQLKEIIAKEREEKKDRIKKLRNAVK